MRLTVKLALISLI